MPGEIAKSNIEADIAELSKKIEEKRRLLDSQNGVIEDKDLLRSALVEQLDVKPSAHTASSDVSSASKAALSQIQTNVKSYLDLMDEESRERVTYFVGLAFEKGLKVAAEAVKSEKPYIVDGFHDVLKDRVYDEMKNRGLLS